MAAWLDAGQEGGGHVFELGVLAPRRLLAEPKVGALSTHYAATRGGHQFQPAYKWRPPAAGAGRLYASLELA